MRKYEFLFMLSLMPLFLSAQNSFRLDTIKVDKNDSRNIHSNQDNSPRYTNEVKPRITQEEQPQLFSGGFDKSKLRFGANIGLSLSRNYTVFGLGPQVGYQFNDYFMAGAGLKYYYTKVRTYDYEIKNNLFGTNVFGYFYPVRFIALFAQPEMNYIWSNLTNRTSGEVTTEKGFVPSFVVGGGLRLGRSHITLNYDLAKNPRSPYPSGFYLGFSTFF